MRKLVSIALLGLLVNSFSLAQEKFYKQFAGKVNNQSVRFVLIKAPDKVNLRNNLRGHYYFDKIGKRILLNNGEMDALGNIYLEEGIYRKENLTGVPTFVKTGSFTGFYNIDKKSIEGTWVSADGHQNSNFYLSEDYNNASIPAEVIFNDINYEEALIRFHYLRFHHHPKAEMINQFVQDKILSNKKEGNMLTQMTKFMQRFSEEKSLGGMVDVFESSNILYIIHNEHNILSLKYKQESYTGGAHSNNTNTFFNFNLKTGQPIKLSDIFTNTYEEDLSQIVETQLRKMFGIRNDQSLASFGFTLPKGKFTLTENFYIQREGIGFFYNPYEIASYAVGSQDIFIPYSKMKSLIRENSLLHTYLR